MAERRLTIRAVEPDDHGAWAPLWEGYLRFYKAAVPEEATRVAWSRLLDPAEPMHAALAWSGPAAVGMVHWITHRSTWTIGDYCYLQDLFVAPGARGDGVGRSLIEHVYEDATRRGCSRVYWLTHETNRDAMALYDKVAERSGFVQYRKAIS
jgi:GNAT superfamily N-acetyltransferase